MSKTNKVAKEKIEETIEQKVEVQTLDMDAEVKKHGSVSAVIRYLDSQGHKRGTIAKMTGKRYQHVRNVLITPIKKVQ